MNIKKIEKLTQMLRELHTQQGEIVEMKYRLSDSAGERSIGAAEQELGTAAALLYDAEKFIEHALSRIGKAIKLEIGE
jgi:hypothetical protein